MWQGKQKWLTQMENAQLINLSRQVVLQRKMDVIANNLANINTGGYKSDSILFEDFMMPKSRDNAPRGFDRRIHFVQDDRILHDFTAGSIIETDNPLNAAISGDGFFVIETPAGERYTRNGSFETSPAGNLVTQDGYPVLGVDGPISFEEADQNILIARDGTISASGQRRGRLRIVNFENVQSLEKEASTIFKGENAQDIETPHIMQGSIERSNVQAVREMANMIQVTRSYTSLANIMKEANDLRERAINSLGSLQA